MKIYTKTGDHGETSLVGGQRVSKCCQRLESYGTVDELNSFIGVLMTYVTDSQDAELLQGVQQQLFVLGGYLATDTSTREPREGNIIETEMVQALEQEIDRIQQIIPPLKLFILPGGSRGSALAHVCRTVCRRVEREMLRLNEECGNLDDNVFAYVNRLSDYLFVLARKINFDDCVEDVVWRRTK